MNYSSTKFGVMLVASAACFFCAGTAQAYPEFQAYAEKKSGRAVDCAMCHLNEHGPVGQEEGQIGKLTPEELNLLNQARAAMEPGMNRQNPILNAFGNDLVESIGMKGVLDTKQHPENLAEALGPKRDFDKDGIPDGKEFQSGSDPSNPYHGDPFELLKQNLSKYRNQVAMAAAAIFLLDFGFAHLISGLNGKSKTRRPDTFED